RAGAGLFYEDAQISGRFGFLHAFAQDRLSANETETGGYTDLRAELRYRFIAPFTGAEAVELAIVGENLLDEDIRIHSSFKKNDLLQPGRDIRLVATARFGSVPQRCSPAPTVPAP